MCVNDAVVDFPSRMGRNVAPHVRDKMNDLRRRLLDTNLNIGARGYGIFPTDDGVQFKAPCTPEVLIRTMTSIIDADKSSKALTSVYYQGSASSGSNKAIAPS